MNLCCAQCINFCRFCLYVTESFCASARRKARENENLKPRPRTRQPISIQQRKWVMEREKRRKERRRGWCINILSGVWGQEERTGKGWERGAGARNSPSRFIRSVFVSARARWGEMISVEQLPWGRKLKCVFVWEKWCSSRMWRNLSRTLAITPLSLSLFYSVC